MSRLWVALLLLLPLALHASDGTTYQGFTIDDSRLKNAPNLAQILEATHAQIDLVLEVGLPDQILEFFRGVHFNLVPAGILPHGTPGLYSSRDQAVSVTAAVITVGHKPVLLHELMHAYHDQRIKRGFRNPDILRYYEQAKGISAFAAKSHMMSDVQEFFACSATTYLFGVTAQEPYQRAKVQQNQPEFFQYLQVLFGPGTGSYQGSLGN
jgi:hypothetical protein